MRPGKTAWMAGWWLFLWAVLLTLPSGHHHHPQAAASAFLLSSPPPPSALSSSSTQKTTRRDQPYHHCIIMDDQYWMMIRLYSGERWPKQRQETALSSKDDNNSNDSIKTQLPLIAGCFPRSVAAPLAILIASQFLLFIGVGAVIPSIPLYGKEIGLSSAANGVVISAPAVALLLLAKKGGNFADQARKPAMLWGMALIVVSDLGTAVANGLVTLIVARLGLGAGRCFSEAGERGMLADLSKQAPDLRGRALSAQQAAVALGIAIGAPVGGYVVESYGPRAAFLCVSAAAAVTWLLYGLLPETTGEVYNLQKRTDKNENVDDNNKRVDRTVETEVAFLGPSEAVDLNKNDSIAKGDWDRLLSTGEWRGLALCQCGASFGFAAKVASIPILASATLPGGAVGAGALLSAAGLSGIVGAPVGGWLTDRTSAKDTAILSGLVSATGLMLIPFALALPTESLSLASNNDIAISLMGMDMNVRGLAFSAAVILWSLGASSQGPALTALAQELAPIGAEATAMALPRASGDGTYIIAPFILGLVTDNARTMPGAECAVAGSIMIIGALALGILGRNSSLAQR